MTIAELSAYEQVKALPEQLAREVLDFVGYLRDRQDDADRRDLMNAQAGSLAPGWTRRGQSLGRCLSAGICCSLRRAHGGSAIVSMLERSSLPDA